MHKSDWCCTFEPWRVFRPEYTAQAIVIRYLNQQHDVSLIQDVLTFGDVISDDLHWEVSLPTSGTRFDIVEDGTLVYEVKRFTGDSSISAASAQAAGYAALMQVYGTIPEADLGENFLGRVIKYRANDEDWLVWGSRRGVIMFDTDNERSRRRIRDQLNVGEIELDNALLAPDLGLQGGLIVGVAAIFLAGEVVRVPLKIFDAATA